MMLNNEQLHHLNKLSDRLELVQRRIQAYRYNTPLNRQQERARLLEAHRRGDVYNPQFKFRKTPNDWDVPFRKLMRDVRPDNNLWEGLLYRHLQHELARLQSLATHDPQQITAVTLEAHGAISPRLVDQAWAALQHPATPPPPKTIPDVKAADHMNDALDVAGLDAWQVVINDSMNARMMVASAAQEVHVGRGRRFSRAGIRRLLIHEVGTHVFRYANGRNQPLRLLRNGLVGYVVAEEGLATYHEKLYGVQDDAAKRRYALRVLAADMALTHSFYDVISFLMQYTGFDEAFKVTVRAKRGFTDTSQPGAHIKDKVYLEGYLRVTDHLHAHPADYDLLMSGKVSFEMLDWLRQLKEAGQLAPPRYLPRMLQPGKSKPI